jgi:glycosyltransferase involved in cell wall biosynthesis
MDEIDLRVLLVSDVFPPLVGGQEREIQILGEGLRREGCDVAVCTLRQGTLPHFREENGVRVYRIEGFFQRIPHLYSNPERKFHPPVADQVVVNSLRKLIRYENPDIIHANGWMLYSVLSANKTYKLPLIVTFHDFGFTCPRRWSPLYFGGVCDNPLSAFSECLQCGKNTYGLTKAFLSYCCIKLNRSFTCDALIFTNPNLLEKMDYLKPRKFYLEHPIETDFFKPVTVHEYNDRVLIWAKLDRMKGIQLIFRIARMLPEYAFDSVFVGDDRSYYKAMKPDNVTFLPKLAYQEIPQFINRYPLVIGQLLVGAFGHAELEAMSCGKPVVAYWKRKYDAFYGIPCPILSSRNVEKLKDLVVSNMGDSQVGAAGREWVIKNHSVSKVSSKLVKVYGRIVEHRRFAAAPVAQSSNR